MRPQQEPSSKQGHHLRRRLYFFCPFISLHLKNSLFLSMDNVLLVCIVSPSSLSIHCDAQVVNFSLQLYTLLLEFAFLVVFTLLMSFPTCSLINIIFFNFLKTLFL